MGDEGSGFGPPPFQSDEALQRLRRELRALGLVEREGRFELRGQAVARATLQDSALQAAVARRPARSPEWQLRSLNNNGQLRDFLAELKKRLADWNNRDD